jgi:hypothetical protein
LLRIVGVHKEERPEREFVLLQNQGSMRVNLKGHALLSQSAFEGADLCSVSHAFCDDVYVSPGLYVVLYTGHGTPGWRKSKDGSIVYNTFMGCDEPVWTRCNLPLHMLNTQHTYIERGEPLLLR